jgi:hypothetical protein
VLNVLLVVRYIGKWMANFSFVGRRPLSVLKQNLCKHQFHALQDDIVKGKTYLPRIVDDQEEEAQVLLLARCL